MEDRGVLPKEENISGKREWLRLSSVMRMEKCVGFGGMRSRAVLCHDGQKPEEAKGWGVGGMKGMRSHCLWLTSDRTGAAHRGVRPREGSALLGHRSAFSMFNMQPGGFKQGRSGNTKKQKENK